MPRPRYQIADEDVPVVHRWVYTKFRDAGFPQQIKEVLEFAARSLDVPVQPNVH
jgi:hypothetical protein